MKVFILLGQSNMVGMGDILPEDKPGTLTTLTKTEKRYPFLLDDAGQWTARKDVYYYDARVKKGGALTATSNGNAIGPELGFGFVMGQLLDEPVLILKSCIGKPPVCEHAWISYLTGGDTNGEGFGKLTAGYGARAHHQDGVGREVALHDFRPPRAGVCPRTPKDIVMFRQTRRVALQSGP